MYVCGLIRKRSRKMEDTLKCKNCGYEPIKPNWRYCPKCKQPLKEEPKQQKRCWRCNEELENWMDTCPACGESVNEGEADRKTMEEKDTSENEVKITENSQFVFVEGGTFQMGSTKGNDNEKPVHTVTVSSFNISKYQVTQKEWQEVMGNNPSKFKGENLPVESVSWYEAVDYCNKRSLKEGLTSAYRGSDNSITCDWNANGYRLPTEAEWEFAAKGGTKDYLTTEYSGSNNVDAVAWYVVNSGKSAQPVGMKKANILGIHDMSGNVWEWCWDRYGNYLSESQTDPRGPISGTSRVARGGSWYHTYKFARSAYRTSRSPSDRTYDYGFRLVRP
jgi:formylglycine-generating enzyme required for sulfatase activity